MEYLKNYLKKEEPQFEKRETAKRATLNELDAINAEQNKVRGRVADMGLNYQEINMALENLKIEAARQEKLEILERKKLIQLLKIFYRMKRDGVIHYLLGGDSHSGFGSRLRVVLYAVKLQSQLNISLIERARRIEETGKKLFEAKENSSQVLAQLGEQERILKTLLGKKRKILREISKKQSSYLEAKTEYRKIASRVSKMFKELEAVRGNERGTNSMPRTLAVPVQTGKLLRRFGKSVHESFGTVVFQKGIEIEAPHQSPVYAVADGTVEFDGWVRGLGNVLILHHGDGLYSLSAHLFKSLAQKGASVAKEEPIALVGDTGQSELSSLYFEIRLHGEAKDPLSFFAPGWENQILEAG